MGRSRSDMLPMNPIAVHLDMLRLRLEMEKRGIVWEGG